MLPWLRKLLMEKTGNLIAPLFQILLLVLTAHGLQLINWGVLCYISGHWKGPLLPYVIKGTSKVYPEQNNVKEMMHSLKSGGESICNR